jgi:hypothetical protein
MRRARLTSTAERLMLADLFQDLERFEEERLLRSDFPCTWSADDRVVFRMNDFTRGALECALTMVVNHQSDFEFDDFHPPHLRQLQEECWDFWKTWRKGITNPALAGRSFWIARAGRGNGFYGCVNNEVHSDIAHAAHMYGTRLLYLHSDGKIHVVQFAK